MLGVFIGRFQPMHSGHIEALKEASSKCSHLLILIGSADACISIKNPWSYNERKAAIEVVLKQYFSNFSILPVNDYPYNDSEWVTDVRNTVDSVKEKVGWGKVALFGHYKKGNDYLNWFPEYIFYNIESKVDINATKIRESLFKENSPYLKQTVLDDFKYYEKEKELFKNYPFPETLNFNCGDAILECQGNIVLVKRKNSPGMGAWALPGGFRNVTDKSFKDCAIRELIEETGVKVPEKVLKGSIVGTKLFDSNTRSFGIPRNTLAVYIRIDLDNDGKLPKLKPADDAADAQWFTLHEVLNSLPLYDDHKSIISTMTGVSPLPAYLNAIYH